MLSDYHELFSIFLLRLLRQQFLFVLHYVVFQLRPFSAVVSVQHVSKRTAHCRTM